MKEKKGGREEGRKEGFKVRLEEKLRLFLPADEVYIYLTVDVESTKTTIE